MTFNCLPFFINRPRYLFLFINNYIYDIALPFVFVEMGIIFFNLSKIVSKSVRKNEKKTFILQVKKTIIIL